MSSQPTSSTVARQRLTALTAQMSAQKSVSNFSAVPLAPADPLFGLMAAYRADESPQKVDLGIGAYRDNNAKPWVLPVVRKVGSFSDWLAIELLTGTRPSKSLPMIRIAITNISRLQVCLL